jgi:hypothetical protein
VRTKSPLKATSESKINGRRGRDVDADAALKKAKEGESVTGLCNFHFCFE